MFASSADMFALAQQMRKQRLDEMRRNIIAEEEEEKKKCPLTFKEFMEMNSEKGLRELTNFDLNQFNELCEMVRGCFIKSGRGNRTKLTVKERMFWVLYYLNTGGKIREICHMFRCSDSEFYKRCVETLELMAPVLSKMIPESVTETSRKFKNYPNAVGACDVCFVPIVRPRDYEEQKKYYSGKHKQHG